MTRTVRTLGTSAAAQLVETGPAVAPVGRLVRDMSREEYDALGDEHWSTLKEMLRSPQHYLHRRNGNDVDTTPKRNGRVTHLAVLEPGRFLDEVAVWGGGDRRGAAWKDFAERNAAREVLKADEYAACRAVASAVGANPKAARILASGFSEVSLQWRYVEADLGGVAGFEVKLKGRVDWEAPDCLADLKRTRDASPEGFGRECHRYGHHIQAALYVDGYAAATERVMPYKLIAVEDKAPHVVQVYDIDEELLNLGRDEYRRLLRRAATCRREGMWPGYSSTGDEMPLTLPRWALPDDTNIDEVGLTFGEEPCTTEH